jgi:hypothetical protein
VHRRAHRREHPLGVVARRAGFDHHRQPVGVEAGQEQAALDLGAGHGHGVFQAAQPRRADGQRRVVAVLPPHDVRAHAAQRAGDASHRAAANLRGAVEEADELLPDQQPGEQRIVVPELPQSSTSLAPASRPAAPVDDQLGRREHVDLHAQLAHHADRRAAVAAVEEVAHVRRAFGNATEHHGAVADRLVAGHGAAADE